MAVRLDKKGREIVDPTPSNLNVRRQRMVGLSDQMRQIVTQMRHEAVQAENDSLEDDKDFDIEDDEPRSPHELFVETEEYSMLLDDIVEFARKSRGARAEAGHEDEKPIPLSGSGKPAAAKKGNPPPAASEPDEG